MLFVGTQCSNLYTSVDTPARGRVVQCIKAVTLRQLRQESKTSCLEYGISISTRNCDEICEERKTLVPCSIISFMILLGRERLTAAAHDVLVVPIFIKFALDEVSVISIVVPNIIRPQVFSMVISDNVARIINAENARANWLAKGGQRVESVPVCSLLRRIRPRGQRIVHVQKNVEVVNISLERLTFLMNVSNGFDMRFYYFVLWLHDGGRNMVGLLHLEPGH